MPQAFEAAFGFAAATDDLQAVLGLVFKIQGEFLFTRFGLPQRNPHFVNKKLASEQCVTVYVLQYSTEFRVNSRKTGFDRSFI